MRKNQLQPICLVAVLLLCHAVVVGSEAQAIWGNREGNPQNTAFTPLAAPLSPTVQWTLEGESGPDTASYPVVASDGTLYTPALQRRLLAINPDGTIKRELRSGGNGYRHLTIDHADGVVSFIKGLSPESARHVDKDGLTLPRLALGNQTNVGSNGTIYGSRNRLFIAADPSNGQTMWSVETDTNGALAGVSPDGSTVYVSDRSSLRALTADGLELWAYDTYGTSPAPVVRSDGAILTRAHLDGAGVALSPDGTVLWANPGIAGNRANILASPSGESFWVSEILGGIVAVSADGQTMWSRSMDIRSNAVLTGNGLILVSERAEAQSFLRAVSASTGEELWSFDPGPNVYLDHITPGGEHLIYVGGRDGNKGGESVLYSIIPEPGAFTSLLGFLALTGRWRPGKDMR